MLFACSVLSNSSWPHGPHSLPGSSVLGISQAGILEWVTISFSRRSSWPRHQTHVSCISCIGRQSLLLCHLGSLKSCSNYPQWKLAYCLLSLLYFPIPLLSFREHPQNKLVVLETLSQGLLKNPKLSNKFHLASCYQHDEPAWYPM